MNPNTARTIAQQVAANAKPFNATFYVYPITFLAIANGAQATGSFQTQSDSDFELAQMSFYCANAGTAYPAPNITVQLTDTGSQNNIFLSPLPVSTIFGTAAQPFILPISKILVRNALITATVLNSDGAARDLYLVFIGQKIYY